MVTIVHSSADRARRRTGIQRTETGVQRYLSRLRFRESRFRIAPDRHGIGVDGVLRDGGTADWNPTISQTCRRWRGIIRRIRGIWRVTNVLDSQIGHAADHTVELTSRIELRGVVEVIHGPISERTDNEADGDDVGQRQHQHGTRFVTGATVSPTTGMIPASSLDGLSGQSTLERHCCSFVRHSSCSNSHIFTCTGQRLLSLFAKTNRAIFLRTPGVHKPNYRILDLNFIGQTNYLFHQIRYSTIDNSLTRAHQPAHIEGTRSFAQASRP